MTMYLIEAPSSLNGTVSE